MDSEINYTSKEHLFNLNLENLEQIKNTKNIVFDWDDTIVHIEHQKHLQIVIEILENFGIENLEEVAKQFLDNVHNEKLRTFTLRQAFVDTNFTAKDFWESYRNKCAESKSFYYLSEGFLTLLNTCKQNNIKVFIISNSSTEALAPTFDKFFTSPSFEEVICLSDANSIFSRKPDNSSYLYLKEKYKLDDKSTLYVGNSYTDHDYSVNSGILPVMVNKNADYKNDEKQSLIVFRSFRDLDYILKKPQLRNVSSNLNTPIKSLNIQPNLGQKKEERALGHELSTAVERSKNRQLELYLRAQEMFSKTPYPNVFNLELSAHNYFDAISGSIKINSTQIDDFKNPAIRDFINDPQNSLTYKNSTYLRGQSYYFSLDKEIGKKEKLSKCLSEIKNLTASHNQIKGLLATNSGEYLVNLGILDNLRHQIITLFHFTTYPERFVNLMTITDADFFNLKTKLLQSLELVNKGFYDSMIGNYNNLDFSSLSELESLTTNFFRKYIDYYQDNWFKLPEVDNHMTFILNALGNIELYKDTDTLVFLPSGGTQLAFTNKYFYEAGGDKTISLIDLPISIHSSKKSDNLTPSVEGFVSKLESHTDAIQNNSVLILDDNSNSGSSLQIASEAVSTYDPADINVSISEIDPIRVLLKTGRGLTDNIPDYELIARNATSIVPVSRGDQQIRKKYISHLLKQNQNI